MNPEPKTVIRYAVYEFRSIVNPAELSLKTEPCPFYCFYRVVPNKINLFSINRVKLEKLGIEINKIKSCIPPEV